MKIKLSQLRRIIKEVVGDQLTTQLVGKIQRFFADGVPHDMERYVSDPSDEWNTALDNVPVQLLLKHGFTEEDLAVVVDDFEVTWDYDPGTQTVSFGVWTA